MATLINNSSGNFTSAATWSVADSTSLLDSETNTTSSTTAFVSSQSFVPGAITIDGIAVKLSAHTLVGTCSVRLFDVVGAAAVPGTTVTINTADLPTVNTATQVGWTFMKFSAPVLLVGATSYTVQISTSTAASVTIYRDATAANWSRILRTTTTQAPAATDDLVITGEYVSAGVNSSFTVTMDNTTSATTFGSVQISGMGTLVSGVAASTDYYLKLLGNLSIYTGGEYNQGTASTPIPSDSTSSLEFANTSNVQFGLVCRVGGVLRTGGNVITSRAFLAADASIGATSLTTDVSTGWKNGDSIGIASTTRTKAESELKALTADAAGTTLTITALTNAHSGTGEIAGELINVTRNCKIFGTSTTFQAYVSIAASTTVDLQSTEFYQLGSATAARRGIDVGTTTLGTCTINNCSMHDYIVTSSIGILLNSSTNDNITITDNVVYNTASVGISTTATTGINYTIDNNIVILSGATCFSINDLRGTVTNLTGISATGAGITLSDNVALTTNVFGTLSGFTAHSNTTAGVSLTNITGITNNPMGLISNLNCWRNTGSGLILSNSFTIMVDTITAFGNSVSNITIGTTQANNIVIKNATVNAGTTLTCPIGFNITADCNEVYIDNSTFGSTTTHSTGDINTALNFYPRLVLRNCVLSSTTPVAGTANMTEGSFISLAKFQQVNGQHRTYKKYGILLADNVIYNSTGISVRLTPNNALSTNKMQGTAQKIAVSSGQTATVKVFVRKSAVGDGTAYNGNEVRLMLKADPAIGITSDTVLATTDATYDGVFKALEGTTPAIGDNAVFQVYLDCDGTTGWINYDDFSIV